MFWKKAHETYGHLTDQDEDIRKYLSLSGSFQEEGYTGLVGKISDLGHKWLAQRTPAGPVLEIGTGAGRHRLFYSGPPENFFHLSLPGASRIRLRGRAIGDAERVATPGSFPTAAARSPQSFPSTIWNTFGTLGVFLQKCAAPLLRAANS